MIHLSLYSRPDCHLCEQMKEIIHRAAATFPFTLDEIDISASPELESRYGVEIPVLMIDGKKVAKYRISEAELRRILISRSGGSGRSGESGG